jgi:hypothetical protein
VLPLVVATAVTSQSKLKDVTDNSSTATTTGTTSYKSTVIKSLGSTDKAPTTEALAFKAAPGGSQPIPYKVSARGPDFVHVNTALV